MLNGMHFKSTSSVGFHVWKEKGSVAKVQPPQVRHKKTKRILGNRSPILKQNVFKMKAELKQWNGKVK